MPPLFEVRLISPDRVVFEGRAQSMTAPGREGSFGVLYEHAPMLAQLGTGELKVTDERGEERFFAVSGGFLEVTVLSQVNIAADAAEAAQDIDVARAQVARQRAQERLVEQAERIDRARAAAALVRALNRLQVAERRR